MTRRWPRRPEPLDGEALSSWLRRVAAVYGMSLRELLVEDLEMKPGKLAQIDWNFRYDDLECLSGRSGFPVDRLRLLTAFMGAETSLRRTFQEYLGDMRILLIAERPKNHIQSVEFPWVDTSRWRRPAICSECLRSDPEPYLRLSWRFAFISTCPVHGVFLQKVPQSVADLKSPPDISKVKAAPEDLLELDRKTMRGLRDGEVEHSGHAIPVGEWLKMLRCLIQELRAYQYLTAWYDRGLIEGLWLRSGARKPPRGVYPANFEKLTVEKQMDQMRAVATTVRLLGSGRVLGRGEHSHLLEPADGERRREFKKYRSALVHLLREIRLAPTEKRQDELIGEARGKPPLWRAFRDYILFVDDDEDIGVHPDIRLLDLYL